MSGAARIVLASASPRRSELLAAAGLRFEVEASDADETLEGRPEPERAAVELAERKAREVAGRHAGERLWLIGADTVVALRTEGGWSLLGKPRSAEEAARMLRSLSNTSHRVCTGVCVVDARSGAARSAAETTVVTMRALCEEEVAAYVESGEWRDKAGGYAIQETADRFVTSLGGGGFDNVVGLPVALTLELLADCGAPLP